MFSRGRGFELLLGSVTLGLVLWSASTACSAAGAPTAPAGTPCGGSFTDPNCAGIVLNPTANGAFTVIVTGVAGQISNSGVAYTYGLMPGTYTVSGTMSSSTLDIYIQTGGSYTAGGVERGTVQSTKGPFVATPSLCHVSYSATGNSPPPQDYSFTFTVGTVTPLC